MWTVFVFCKVIHDMKSPSKVGKARRARKFPHTMVG